jgi:hypothetical protein
LLQRLVVSQEEQTFKRRMGYAAAPEVTPYSAHGVSRTMPPT